MKSFIIPVYRLSEGLYHGEGGSGQGEEELLGEETIFHNV